MVSKVNIVEIEIFSKNVIQQYGIECNNEKGRGRERDNDE